MTGSTTEIGAAIAYRFAAAIAAAFRRVDVLVNNAALMAHSDQGTSDEDVFDRPLAMSLRAPSLLIQAARPQYR